MRVGPFETERQIGGGGMGVVYLAVDLRSGTRVALKTVPNHTDRDAREILDAEHLGARLHKPFSDVSRRVPKVFEYGLLPECFYISMEYLDGENLSQQIARGGVPIARALEIAHELCGFLDEAHNFETVLDDDKHYRSLLHGDLTSINIRVTADGQIKVFDFGIAKARTLLSRRVPRNDFGSLAYLPPERLGEHPAGMDEHTDLWALGVLLYEMVSGRKPFRAENTAALERLILSRQPPPPLVVMECPAGLWAIISKSLAPTPQERYDSARALREDLDAFHAHGTTRAEREGWPRRASDEDATRRTRPTLDTDKTQRTAPPPLPPAPRVTAQSPERSSPEPVSLETPPRSASPLPRLRVRGRGPTIAAAIALLLAVMLVSNEIVVARSGAALAGVVARQTLPDLTGSWAEYDRLAARSYLGLGTPRLRRALTRQTQSESDAVIGEYRESMVVREGRWTLAREALEHAVAANPDDRNLRAAMRYCAGHLLRINGEARKSRNQRAAAQQELTAAVTEFRAAAELRPRWPDPFLGLARTFVVGLGDIDRGVDALSRAEQLGYRRGARETAQLAEAYDDRGETLEAAARTAQELLQVRDYLTRAAQAYRQSLALSETVLDYGNARENVRIVRGRIDRVERRLAELDRNGT